MSTPEYFRVYVRRYPAKRFRRYSSICPLKDAQETAQRIARDFGWDVEVRNVEKLEAKR